MALFLDEHLAPPLTATSSRVGNVVIAIYGITRVSPCDGAGRRAAPLTSLDIPIEAPQSTEECAQRYIQLINARLATWSTLVSPLTRPGRAP